MGTVLPFTNSVVGMKSCIIDNTLTQQLEPWSVSYWFFWVFFHVICFLSLSASLSLISVSYSLSGFLNLFHTVASLYAFVSAPSAFNSPCHLYVCVALSVSRAPVFRHIKVTRVFSSVYRDVSQSVNSVCECQKPAVQRFKSQQNTFTPQRSVDVDWESSEEWQAFITQWTLWTHILTPSLTAGLSSPLYMLR